MDQSKHKKNSTIDHHCAAVSGSRVEQPKFSVPFNTAAAAVGATPSVQFGVSLPHSNTGQMDSSIENSPQDNSTRINSSWALDDMEQRPPETQASHVFLHGQDFHIPLREPEPVSRYFDRALGIVGDTPMLSYKRELLLDNMNVLQQEAHLLLEDDDLLPIQDLEEDLQGPWGSTSGVGYHEVLSEQPFSLYAILSRSEQSMFCRESFVNGSLEDNFPSHFRGETVNVLGSGADEEDVDNGDVVLIDSDISMQKTSE